MIKNKRNREKKPSKKISNKKPRKEMFSLDIFYILFLLGLFLLLINYLLSLAFASVFINYIRYFAWLLILFSSYSYFIKLGNPLKKSIKYIKESKLFIYIVLGIFFLFSLIGFIIPPPEPILELIKDLLKNLIEQTEGLSAWQLIKYIFFNNLKSSFFAMIFGFIFAIPPLITAILNGYLLGFISTIAINKESILILWRILPHGIFELPAIFISMGLGIKLFTFLFQKDIGKSFFDFLTNSLRVFLFIIIPLLVIAAIIEGILISFIS